MKIKTQYTQKIINPLQKKGNNFVNIILITFLILPFL